MEMDLQKLKDAGEAPEFLTAEGLQTLKGGYLQAGETPKGMYQRVSTTAANRLGKPELASKFFDLMWNNWLGLATPVAANMGTGRNLPISCFSLYVEDSIDGIMGGMHELAMMSKMGGGVGVHWDDVRARGSSIGGGIERSDGIVPFLKIQDSTTIGVSQASARRGASAAYLPIEHGDVKEFLQIRRPQGDTNRQCLNIHHGVSVTDAWMTEMLSGDEEKRDLWKEVLKTRYETGEPYLFFYDAANRDIPEGYKKRDLKVRGSNICCLSGDTLVLTKGGPQKIEDLSGKEVEIWDGLNWVKNNSFSQRGVDVLYRVSTSIGSHVDCNANHRWFVMENGVPVETLTKDLKPGMLLETHAFEDLACGYSNSEIASIEELPGEHPVYCPTLPTTGKFGLANGLMTGNTEIMLATDKDHSFVCCLSSMNLAKYDEWKDTDAVYWSMWFLDAVLGEFIERARNVPGFERSVRFAEKSRAVGLGVLGFHTLLQEKEIPFDSYECFQLNAEIFRKLKSESDRASMDLAKEFGEPEWCEGTGRRNTHTSALAPTVSNAIISGNVSPSIEPWSSNAFARKTAKGTFIHRNKTLEKLLDSKGKNTEEVWRTIIANEGSVQHLGFLTQNEKEVFLTAREINQFVLIKLAGQRQRWIDQGQSINLFFPSNVDPKYFHEVHVEAWKQGLKSLYYCRTESVLKGEVASRDHERKDLLNGQTENRAKETVLYSRSVEECKACEG